MHTLAIKLDAERKYGYDRNVYEILTPNMVARATLRLGLI